VTDAHAEAVLVGWAQNPACPHCGFGTTELHDWRERRVWHLATGPRAVRARLRVPCLRCLRCGRSFLDPAGETYAPPGRRLTWPAIARVLDAVDAEGGPRPAAARLAREFGLRLSPGTVASLWRAYGRN